MISGASEQELELANARANIIMALDNTSTYESWLIIDTYIEKLEQELENKTNEIECLKDQVEWWKQQCDDLEMQIGVEE